jgi:hypothetical protein
MDNKTTWVVFLSPIFVLVFFIILIGMPAPPEVNAQANARALFTGTPESYLPYVARQPTYTPTPTPTFTPTATPTPTRTPTPTPVAVEGIICSYGPFADFGLLEDYTDSIVTDTLSIETTGTIMDLDLFLNVSHTFVGDLIADLTHDDTGTTVQLMDRPGLPAIQPFGCSNNNISAFLDDDSNEPIEDACGDPGDSEFSPGLSGILAPNGLLEDFNGEDLSGEWTLTIEDPQLDYAGTFNDWCLLVDYEG